MGDQKKFRHPSDHATSLVKTNPKPMAFAQERLARAEQDRDKASIEQWLCVITVLQHRGFTSSGT